jgi:hypothetical protein
MNNDYTNFTIQYDNVINAKWCLESTTNLAKKIKNQGYILTSEYIKQLSEEDISHLMNLTKNQNSSDFSELVIISEMLCNAEGLEFSASDEQAANRLNIFLGFLTLETLFRKGLIELYYENMSFGDEYKQLKIANLIKRDYDGSV